MEEAAAPWEELAAALECSLLVLMAKGAADAVEAYSAVSWAVGMASVRSLLDRFLSASDVLAGRTVADALKAERAWSDGVGGMVSSAYEVQRAEQLKRAMRGAVHDGSLFLKRLDGYEEIGSWYDGLCRTAHDAVSRGATYEQAIKGVTDSLAQSGGVKLYWNGRHHDIYGAVRQEVMDAWQGAAQGYRDMVGAQLGMDAVEVSAHAGCAPDHLPFQGRVYTLDEFQRLQDGLERPIGMWNCRHMTTPCWSGSKPSYTDGELEEMRRLSEGQVEVAGRPMTLYEATQWQRGMERRVRASKTQAQVCEAAGDKAGAALERKRARGLAKAYREGSAQAGLPTDARRTRVGRLV